MCDHCNYKVHSIHHHLEVAHIFHTLTDLADECVCHGGGGADTADKVCFLKLFSDLNIISYCFFYLRALIACAFV